MAPSEAPKALQTSECSELLDPMRASCWISAWNGLKMGRHPDSCYPVVLVARFYLPVLIW